MATSMISKVVTTRLGLARRFLSTKSMKGDKWSFLSDHDDTVYSILEEFVIRRISRSEESKCVGRRYSSRGLEILVDVRGFGRENLDVKVSEKMLLINGISRDLLGAKVQVNKMIPLVVPAEDKIFFDPTGVKVEERNGQVNVVFTLTEKELDKDDANYWVRWVKPSRDSL